jgi:DNA-binding beta-propeller fold protein YncE
VAHGASNGVFGYTINPTTGALTAISGSPFATGTNPGSVAVDATGKFAYVTNGLGLLSNTVSGYTINPTTGALTPISGSPFTAGSSPWSVAVDPTGKFAYVTNLGTIPGTVSGYTIDPSTGALTPISGSPFAAGTTPRSVAVDPTGKFAYVANANSNNVSGYRIDPTTGALTPISGSPFATGPTPESVAVARPH